MPSARKTALVSVGAAAFLIAVKLVVGLLTHSLAFLSEALHSGTDLVAALLTFFAVGVAGRPADASHAWGHGKAEHLSALAECVFLASASILIAVLAVRRLIDDSPTHVEATWWAFAVIALVIAVDATRTVISLRAARAHHSPALLANALHFGGDLAGTVAVLVGLIFVRSGFPEADAVAALFVAGLVLIAAAHLARSNVDVLMDRTPTEAEGVARSAIQALGAEITLQRLRMREAAGRHFADVVISVSPSAALAEGHAAADAVEHALLRALPGSDVVVHVEPGHAPADLQELALATALSVPGIREIHNVRVLRTGDRTEVTLHVKLPADVDLADAHRVADRVERAILSAATEVDDVVTHIEPLDGPVTAEAIDGDGASRTSGRIRAITGAMCGREPTELRLIRTDTGLVAFLRVPLDSDRTLTDAHEIAGSIRSRLRRELPELADVFIRTVPARHTAD